MMSMLIRCSMVLCTETEDASARLFQENVDEVDKGKESWMLVQRELGVNLTMS